MVRASGVAHAVVPYEPPERHGRDRTDVPAYGAAAAAALHVEPTRIFKTLIVRVDDRLVCAVVPVAGELDMKRLAAAVGGRRASLAEPVEAERATGYVVGGISPLGQRRTLPVVVDAVALEPDTILVSAGRRGLQIELAAGALVQLSRARVARITRYR